MTHVTRKHNIHFLRNIYQICSCLYSIPTQNGNRFCIKAAKISRLWNPYFLRVYHWVIMAFRSVFSNTSNEDVSYLHFLMAIKPNFNIGMAAASCEQEITITDYRIPYISTNISSYVVSCQEIREVEIAIFHLNLFSTCFHTLTIHWYVPCKD